MKIPQSEKSMRPFQYFTLDPTVIHFLISTWVEIWIIFGTPCLFAFFGLSYLPIFRRMRWRMVVWLLPLLGLLFGLAMGYLNAWGDHHYYTAGGKDHWYYLFGAPGAGLTETYVWDWGEDEEWDFRGDVTIWNGLFWLSVAIGGVIVFWFVALWRAANTALKPPRVATPS